MVNKNEYAHLSSHLLIEAQGSNPMNLSNQDYAPPNKTPPEN